jgi:hypothetical protein
MQQAPFVDGVAFDPFSCLQDSLGASEVDIGRCEVANDLTTDTISVAVGVIKKPPWPLTANNSMLIFASGRKRTIYWRIEDVRLWHKADPSRPVA